MCILAPLRTRHIDPLAPRSIRAILAVPPIRRKEARIDARAMTSPSRITTQTIIDPHQTQGSKRARGCLTKVWNRARPYAFHRTKRWPIHSIMLLLHRTVATSVACHLQNLNKRGLVPDTRRMHRRGTRTWPVSFLRTCSRPCRMLSSREINLITRKMYLHRFAPTQVARNANASDRDRAQLPSHHPTKCWVPNRKRKSTLKT